MDYRRFNIILVSTCLAVCSLFILVNTVVDPYGIFRIDFSKQKRAPNQHLLKMRHVIAHPQQYDSFLFGSSRVGKIDVGRIGNGRYYNLSYSEALPGEYLQDINILLSKDVKIRNILIGLDDFSYKLDRQEHLNDPLRHPYGTWYENLRFYIGYLFKMPQFHTLVEFLEDKPPDVFYDIHASGMVLHKQVDEDIERNVQHHINHKKFKNPFHYEGNRIAETIQDIRMIQNICNKHDINLYMFINPIHITTYLDSDVVQFNIFKKELAQILNYYDFSGLNSITTDNYYYYETSHYRYIVADMIVARIFGDPAVEVPFGFGSLVTRENLDTHLNQLRSQLALIRN
jgi:hypothetical protein